MSIDDDRFARMAKALADPRRFQILEAIASRREVACQRLCEEFPVAQPTMSHHLKELVSAGLIEPWREGQYVFYRFRPDVMREYMAALELRLRLGADVLAASGRGTRTRRD
jgi:ArsR family transcriptional regulator